MQRGDIVDESLILTPVATQGRGDLPQQTVGREAYEMHDGWRQQVGRPLREPVIYILAEYVR